jgi:hypothetical protein
MGVGPLEGDLVEAQSGHCGRPAGVIDEGAAVLGDCAHDRGPADAEVPAHARYRAVLLPDLAAGLGPGRRVIDARGPISTHARSSSPPRSRGPPPDPVTYVPVCSGARARGRRHRTRGRARGGTLCPGSGFAHLIPTTRCRPEQFPPCGRAPLATARAPDDECERGRQTAAVEATPPSLSRPRRHLMGWTNSGRRNRGNIWASECLRRGRFGDGTRRGVRGCRGHGLTRSDRGRGGNSRPTPRDAET